jgi:hypothetical protein
MKKKNASENELADATSILGISKTKRSQELRKARAAIDRFLRWLQANTPKDWPACKEGDSSSPSICTLDEAGIFTWEKPIRKGNVGGFETILKIKIGDKYTFQQISLFAELLEDGFLEQLKVKFDSESEKCSAVSSKINSFMNQTCDPEK